jgi:hypothetical protein
MFGDAMAMRILCHQFGKIDEGFLFRNVSDLAFATPGNMLAGHEKDQDP